MSVSCLQLSTVCDFTNVIVFVIPQLSKKKLNKFLCCNVLQCTMYHSHISYSLLRLSNLQNTKILKTSSLIGNTLLVYLFVLLAYLRFFFFVFIFPPDTRVSLFNISGSLGTYIVEHQAGVNSQK